VAATALAYLPAYRAGYVWDDGKVIVQNARLRTADGLRTIWTEAEPAPQGHYWPLVYTSFWIEYQLWGPNPLGYHAVNVILHIVNSVLLWLLLLRFRAPGAWLAAAVFALHPVHVESVAWVTERKDVLSNCFYLAAFHAYVSYGDRRSRRRYAAALALFLCALLSKSMTVTFPAALLLYLWWRHGRIGRRELVSVVPFVLMAVVVPVLELALQRQGLILPSIPSWPERLIVAGRAVWFYAFKLVWPAPLMTIYPQWELDARAVQQYLFPISAVLALAGVWMARRRIGRGPAALIFFYVVTLAPILGLIPYAYWAHSYVADRFQYLASAGLIVLFAGGCCQLLDRLQGAWRAAGRALPAGLLAVLGVLTFQQAGMYRDLLTFASANVELNPRAWAAQNNLGLALLHEGEAAAAVSAFEKAIEIFPDDPEVHANLALAYARNGEPAAAESAGREAVRMDPEFAGAHSNLGSALFYQRRFAEAEFHYRRALAIDPTMTGAHKNLAEALLAQGKVEEAAGEFGRALELNPEDALAHQRLGEMWLQQGRPAAAAEHLRRALRLGLDSWPVANNLAWLLATCGDPAVRNGPEAVGWAEAANRAAGGPHPKLLDTLAAAYAEAGRFSDAAATARQAAELARRSGAAQLAAELQQRMRLYERGLPFHEAPVPTTD